MTDLTNILTVNEASRWLDVVPATIYLAIKEGRLESEKLLGRIIIPKDAVILYNRKREKAVKNPKKNGDSKIET